MKTVSQSPTDPAFVQDPYPFYEKARAQAGLNYWQDYGMPAAFRRAAVHAILRDRRFGRELPPELANPPPHIWLPSWQSKPIPCWRLNRPAIRAFANW